jgi:hypothetical protein
MRLILGILVMVYLIGVGVELAPTIKANWNNGTASQFSAAVAVEMPRALAWPVILYHRIAHD